MTIKQRVKGKLGSPGPYIAEITNHLDPTYMGGVEVALVLGVPTPITSQTETYTVKYLNPFYGVTSVRHEGNDSNNFNDVQKSYGMWMVPPDIGTRVMVIFVDGDTEQGYWFGCIQDEYQNHMVPGIAASKQSSITAEQERKYGTSYLPVAEFHTKSQTLSTGKKPAYISKPVHPFADRLLAQGLLLDTVRGVTSSSARRETPSAVFGISTPGPLDPNGKKGKIGYEGNRQEPVSRLGGSTFVMDDGDINGQNELVRLRTRTGHQILMHNSQDLIYIANSKGTAWIELTSNGKIDIYAQDSVSIHTEADFNFRADRDVNIEAGRNFNLSVGNDFVAEVKNNMSLIVDQDGKLYCGGDAAYSANGDFFINAQGALQAKTDGMFLSSLGDVDVNSNGTNKFSAAGDTNILSGGTHYETAAEIHMNGPAAAPASDAGNPPEAERLPTYSLPNRSKDAGWSDGNLYRGDPIVSIMQRVPTHEPYDQHESTNPQRYIPERTDAYIGLTPLGKTQSANDPSPTFNTDQPAAWADDGGFINKVIDVSNQLGCDYVDLLACMAFETGRKFDPSLRNRIGATGLIQFIPSTAKSLGTTTDALGALTRTQQMDWVLKYFKAGPIKKLSKVSLEDLYMAILWPAAVGKPLSYSLFEAGTKAYQQNPLDIGNKGYVSKEDAATKVRAQLPYIKSQLSKLVFSGSGIVVTDGDGKSVRIGQ
jgi:hypothetical protein